MSIQHQQIFSNFTAKKKEVVGQLRVSTLHMISHYVWMNGNKIKDIHN